VSFVFDDEYLGCLMDRHYLCFLFSVLCVVACQHRCIVSQRVYVLSPWGRVREDASAYEHRFIAR
jgi:hypothetical protein